MFNAFKLIIFSTSPLQEAAFINEMEVSKFQRTTAVDHDIIKTIYLKTKNRTT